jgi:hypothetical protein
MINTGKEWDWMDNNLMEELFENMKIEAQQIKGGDFENWYEGLSPIRKWLYGHWLKE